MATVLWNTGYKQNTSDYFDLNFNPTISTSTQLSQWNSTIKSAFSLADTVANSGIKSVIQSNDGKSIYETFNSGKATLRIGYSNLSERVISINQFYLVNNTGTESLTLDGNIVADATTFNISGNITSLSYSSKSASFESGLKIIGDFFLTTLGPITGSVNSIESYSTPLTGATANIRSSTLFGIESGFLGWDSYSKTAFLGAATKVSSFEGNSIDLAGQRLADFKYTDFTPVSANVRSLAEEILSGNDTLTAIGGGERIHTGYSGDDLILGDTGNNLFREQVELSKNIRYGSGNDTIDGSGGTDRLFYGSNKLISSYSIYGFDSLNNGVIFSDKSIVDNTGTDSIKNIEFFYFADKILSWEQLKEMLVTVGEGISKGILTFGSNSSDSVVGSLFNDAIDGLNGNDTIQGLAGNDLLLGGGGNDYLSGGDGDDTLGGGEGFDTLAGGAGIDTARFNFDFGDYALSKNPRSLQIEVIFKDGTVDLVLADIERIQFATSTISNDSNINYWGKYTTEKIGSIGSVFRFFNTRDKAFFYTNSSAEKDLILNNSNVNRNNIDEWPYVYQGITFESAHSYSGAVPLYRFYNSQTGHHFFTVNKDEAAYVRSMSSQGLWPFKDEGVAFNVFASDPTPTTVGQEVAVHRFYSVSLNRHFFTADSSEADLIRATGVWTYEGVAFFGEIPGG